MLGALVFRPDGAGQIVNQAIAAVTDFIQFTDKRVDRLSRYRPHAVPNYMSLSLAVVHLPLNTCKSGNLSLIKRTKYIRRRVDFRSDAGYYGNVIFPVVQQRHYSCVLNILLKKHRCGFCIRCDFSKPAGKPSAVASDINSTLPLIRLVGITLLTPRDSNSSKYTSNDAKGLQQGHPVTKIEFWPCWRTQPYDQDRNRCEQDQKGRVFAHALNPDSGCGPRQAAGAA